MAGARTTRRTVDLQTPVGAARAHVQRPASAVGTLLLGHGAGGGIEAPDLQAVAAAAVEAAWAVGLVEQPWRVAGARLAPASARLDAAWVPVVTALRTGRSALPGPLVLGGRSAGARVACRTAAELEAAAVVALAFPLHPPSRFERRRPAGSRAGELALVGGRMLLVVQGRADPFGRPDEVQPALPPGARLVAVDGDHGLKADVEAVAAAVRELLGTLV